MTSTFLEIDSLAKVEVLLSSDFMIKEMPKMRWMLWMEEYWMAGNCEFKWHDMVVRHPRDTEAVEATIGAEVTVGPDLTIVIVGPIIQDRDHVLVHVSALTVDQNHVLPDLKVRVQYLGNIRAPEHRK